MRPIYEATPRALRCSRPYCLRPAGGLLQQLDESGRGRGRIQRRCQRRGRWRQRRRGRWRRQRGRRGVRGQRRRGREHRRFRRKRGLLGRSAGDARQRLQAEQGHRSDHPPRAFDQPRDLLEQRWQVHRERAEGRRFQHPSAGDARHPQDLAVIGATVYGADSGGQKIVHGPFDSFNFRSFDVSPTAPYLVVTDGTYLFFDDCATKTVFKMAPAQVAAKSIATALPCPADMAVDDTHVWTTSTDEGGVYRLPKAPSSSPTVAVAFIAANVKTRGLAVSTTTSTTPPARGPPKKP